jgi:hypothetical protein
MSIIATAVKHLLAAGVTGDDLVQAIADMEREAPDVRIVGKGYKPRYEGGTPRLPDREWWPLRRAVFERDNWTCAYCSKTFAPYASGITADHIVPLSRGGSNEMDNLTACCLPCNSSKSDRLLSEWQGRRA